MTSMVTDNEVERVGTIRNVIYRHLPQEIDANVCRAIAGELAALAASDRDVLVKALHRIEQNWGHCDHCGTPCEGFTDGCCERPSWAPDDPVEVARAALIPLAGEPR